MPNRTYLDSIEGKDKLMKQQHDAELSLYAHKSSAFKESNYVKNQKRNRDGKVYMQSGSEPKSGILARGSDMRRSLILQDSRNPTSTFFNDLADGKYNQKAHTR